MDAPATITPTLAFTPDSPWGRCMAHFLQNLQSPNTRRNYNFTLAAFFSTSANSGPPKMPDQYTREDILWFVHRTTDSPRSRGKLPSASTINARQATISSFYRFASSYTYADAHGHIAVLYDHANPTTGLSYRKVARRYRALSMDELTRLFAVIPKDTIKGLRDRAILLMYLYTARRRSEIANLRWGDLEEGIIVDKAGGRRMGFLYHFSGKGRQTIDDITELPLPAKEALDRYLTASGRRATLRPESPLFTSSLHPSRAEKLLLGDSIAFIMKEYVRKAGLDTERITLHSLRHTATQLRYGAGEDILSLQNLLRHESLDTTRRYLEGLMGTADEGAKLLEARIKQFSG